MAAASMNYLSGARGASVIPGFANGGFVGRRNNATRTSSFYDDYLMALALSGDYWGMEFFKAANNRKGGMKKGILKNIYKQQWTLGAAVGAGTRLSTSRGGVFGANTILDTSRGGVFGANTILDTSRGGVFASSSRQDPAKEKATRWRIYSEKLSSLNRRGWVHKSDGEELYQMYLNNLRLDRESLAMFAKGGYVNRPTLGWIGEGGESEYIIPSSRMAQSAMAYLNGARGAAVLNAPGFATGGYVGAADRSSNPLQALMDRVGTIDSLTVNEPPQINDGPIQVTTGPVLEFDGQRYVTMEDYQRGLRDVKRQTLGELRTAAGRRATGR
jgi:hypothetical protein